MKKQPAIPAIIDGDGHLYEETNLWVERIDRKYKDAAPRLVADGDAAYLMMEGSFFPNKSGPNVGKPLGLRDHKWRGRVHDHLSDDPDVRGQSPELRLEDMTEMGVDVAVLYPTLGLHVAAGTDDPDYGLACARAYNDWLYDYCQADPRRLFGIAMLPMQDVTNAARELDRAVTKLGFRGAFIRPSPIAGRALDNPYFDPLWAEAEGLDVPVNTHEVTGCGTVPSAGADQFDNFFFTHSTSHSMQTMVAFAQIVAGGVMSRHPRLKVAFLESGVGWLPFWLDRLDEHYEMHPEWVPWLEKAPSAHFREQGFIGAEAEEEMLAYAIERCGSDRILFASDYPHWDASPDPVGGFLAKWEDRLSVDDQANVMCHTAERLYKIDLLALDPKLAVAG